MQWTTSVYPRKFQNSEARNSFLERHCGILPRPAATWPTGALSVSKTIEAARGPRRWSSSGTPWCSIEDAECFYAPPMEIQARKTTCATAKQGIRSRNAKRHAGLLGRLDVFEERVNDYLSGKLFDIVAFEHSFNDIIQAMLAERDGIDTTHANWFEILPRMIELISKDFVDKTLEANVKEEFLGLIHSCLTNVKQGGYIISNHFMYQIDLDFGYNRELYENMLPIIRKWIHTLEGIEEVQMQGFEPQYWMFIKKL